MKQLSVIPKSIFILNFTHQEQVAICIKDNGKGMSEGVAYKVFAPFFTTKPVGKGTGLGLSTCYQIVVEQHCGKIYCYSQVGKGTEFRIEIPVKQAKIQAI